jgi:hypothetical protein
MQSEGTRIATATYSVTTVMTWFVIVFYANSSNGGLLYDGQMCKEKQIDDERWKMT